MDQSVLDVFHQWNHTLCVLLCLLLSLSITFSGSIHVIERFLHPFSWLRDAPGCGGTTFVYPSSVDGHLGCFHSGCYESCCCEHVSSCECVCVCVSFPLDIYLGVELLNHKVIFFNFLRNYGLFSTAATLFYIPPAMDKCLISPLGASYKTKCPPREANGSGDGFELVKTLPAPD